MEDLLLAAICFCIFCILALIYYPSSSIVYGKRPKLCLFICSLIVYATIGCTTGDFDNYEKLFRLYAKNANAIIHLEAWYRYLCGVASNYYVWRLIVWGIGYSLLYYFLIVAKLNNRIFCLVFLLLCHIQFSNLRESLAIVSLFVLFVCLRRRNRIDIWICIFSFIIACNFHKSAPISLFIMALCQFKWPNNFVRISILLFPFSCLLVDYVLSEILISEVFSDEFDQSVAVMATSRATKTTTLFGYIGHFVHKGVIVFILIIMAASKSQQIILKNKTTLFSYKYAYLCIYISSVTFTLDVLYHLPSRYWYSAHFPLAVAYSSFLADKGRLDSKDYIAISWLIFSNLYYYFYFFYSNLLK